MEFGETIFITPEEFTKQFGVDLASETWRVDVASTQLSVVLHGLRCDAGLITDDLNTLMSESGQKLLSTQAPEFKTLLKLTTRGIVFREDFDDEPQLDKAPVLPPDFTIEDAINNTLEGVVWVDPKAALWRDKMTTQSAILLKALVSGLEQGGYPKDKSKAALREEIEDALDELATSTSYAAAYLMPILATIMRKANLSNWQTTIHWARRLRTMVQAHRGTLPPRG